MPEKKKILSDCYVFLLSKAYQKGHQLVRKRLKPFGITNVQYVILEMLWEKEGLTAVELGTQLKIDKATLSGILDRMTESGFLIKKQDDQDRRMVHLFPSKKVNRMKVQLTEERKSANEELLAGFTIEERVVLRRLLLEML
ncbi:MAG: MarR family transcriptional regulator [Deltaproteobacteria bacterium]|jgi:DNA-binding MarR family transcriptional regulator|nr:MarR family transcriptional regulator [Deltaproteobacteria bacterium]MBT4088312.1 MarR family transcriptional regulator [Deltaproteobacteria bacterium]MBT4267840.1 MarR family transcriptional regulator [Deltaproteobacteria bacterium]MBT4638241.1 MarR family transcriptional regulator [Deltaproteobacteria bacterium]MBT6504211.1 MarR family transcriptional regulator [Deltaproteobacteria bacterium]